MQEFFQHHSKFTKNLTKSHSNILVTFDKKFLNDHTTIQQKSVGWEDFIKNYQQKFLQEYPQSSEEFHFVFFKSRQYRWGTAQKLFEDLIKKLVKSDKH